MIILQRQLFFAGLVLITTFVFESSSISSCECSRTITWNGMIVKCILGRQSLEMPKCTAIFEQTSTINCSRENIIVTDGEYTGSRRMINITCTSSYPIDVDFDGVLPHRSIAISFYRTKMDDTINKTTSTLIMTMNTEQEITGRYNIFGIKDRNLNTSFYIFAEAKDSPFLLHEGHRLNAKEDDNKVIFPCRSFNRDLTISLRKLNSDHLIRMDENAQFDPTVGFIFKKDGPSVNLEGIFVCSVENFDDKVEINTEKGPSLSVPTEDQKPQINVTGKGAACVLERKNKYNFRLINMRARNPSEAGLKKKCLEGDNECIGKREGSLNACSYAQYCKTVDFKDGGGIVSCFRRNSKSFPDPSEYLLGLDQKTYLLNSEMPSTEEILPLKALITIDTNEQNLFYSKISYTFSCTAISYLFAQPLMWSLQFKNGSVKSINIHNRESAIKEVPLFNNYKSEQELMLPVGASHLICSAFIWNSEKILTMAVPISVEESLKPTFTEVTVDVKFIFNHTVQRLECRTNARPPSKIEWRKNNEPIKSDKISVTNNSLHFYQVGYDDAGIYTCFVSNPLGNATKFFRVTIEEQTEARYLITVGVPLVILWHTVVITVLLLKYYRRKKRGLTKEEIEEFMQGRSSTEEMDNNCGDESDIQYMPYPKQYEIEDSSYQIDKSSVLGSGAYGMVYSGNVLGRNVAVKTLKKYSDISYLRSLLSELKVMSYLKEHPNIVNLVGADTQCLHKGIVFVMVELCPLGSLGSYLKKNRPFFRSLYAEMCDYLNAPAIPSLNEDAKSDEFTTADLINWSHQVAKGMEYLSSKKVIHGDLAVRNLLLFDKTLVKISDFGLSRKLYEYSTYVKKSQEPLPWRYLALETLKDLSFSTESDVWAYGITLWEIFSLAEVPYVGLSWTPDFIDKIENGLRMAKPRYANQDLHQVILHCWENNPSRRPSFSDLRSTIENLLM